MTGLEHVSLVMNLAVMAFEHLQEVTVNIGLAVPNSLIEDTQFARRVAEKHPQTITAGDVAEVNKRLKRWNAGGR